MTQSDQSNFIATDFISCSLREEDKPFIDFIVRILKAFRILPIGTVGMFSAAPLNPTELMKINIPKADFVVVVATPRYIQKEIKAENTKLAISEMLQVESAMAYMADKPLVVFVKEGTEVGHFIENVTQYITLNGKQTDLEEKWKLIGELLYNTYETVRIMSEQKDNKFFLNRIIHALALYGGFKFLKAISEEEKPKKRTLKRNPNINKC